MYDFDGIVERRNTNSLKYDFTAERSYPEDILPLWVADMDFRTPPEVVEAVVAAAQHGIFGYTEAKKDYYRAVSGWFERRFGWQTQPEWIVKAPGVVYAIATAVRATTEEGQGVLIQQPVYYPFAGVVKANNRKLVVNELVYEDGAYRIDFEEFERNIVQNQVKLFLLCSPHNPVGRVWKREELTALGRICEKHGVIVVSDEIHCDFVYEGHTHTVFADICPEFAGMTITCTAPSKTFNLAGLQAANIIISNEKLRRRFQKEINRSGYSQLNTLGLVACQAAYEKGEKWLEELKRYLSGNLQEVRSFLQERLPQIRLVEPEGTYLVWLDCSGLGMTDEQLEDFMVNKAKLWLDEGSIFGQGGSGFERINIACPRSLLRQALEQLEQAVCRL